MKSLINRWRATRAERLWLEYVRLCAVGDREEAHRVLMKIEVGVRGALLWRVGYIAECGFRQRDQDVVDAFADLEQSQVDLLDDTDFYLYAYAKWRRGFAMKRLTGEAPSEDGLDRDIERINLSRVPPIIYHLYPLPIHPDWSSKYE